MTAWKRPNNCPRGIRSHWEGISYPDEHGLQVRVSVNGERRSRYYSYAAFDGDALKAHRAAAEWRMQVLAGKKFKLRSRGFRERTLRRREDGVLEHSLVCTAQRPDGSYTQVKIYIGTENTATKDARRRAKLRAEMWWGQYRRWYEEGGRHPMDSRATA